ncbi:MAG: GNAT family N-acyltransferase [Pseudomonadota bacterium]
MRHLTDDYELKLADTPEEEAAAERLRWQVFVDEMGAKPTSLTPGRESDRFDAYADHLILKDRSNPNEGHNVVGVYRLLRGTVAQAHDGFYSSSEYDLSPLVATGRPTLELGRTCIAEGHRGGIALRLLWIGLSEYVAIHGVELLFGVASFPGTDPKPYTQAMAHLGRSHRADPALRAVAHGADAIPLDRLGDTEPNPVAAVKSIPPLLKSYLRIGGKVGDGAYIDHDFNTIDVFLVMDTAAMAAMRSVAAPARRAA